VRESRFECRSTLPPDRTAALRAEMATARLNTREFEAISSVQGGERLTKQLIELAHERIEETRRAYRRARLEISGWAANHCSTVLVVCASNTSFGGSGTTAAHRMAIQDRRSDEARRCSQPGAPLARSS
jgi:hypothetical protein